VAKALVAAANGRCRAQQVLQALTTCVCHQVILENTEMHSAAVSVLLPQKVNTCAMRVAGGHGGARQVLQPTAVAPDVHS
jgi:hypothetical protein